MCSFSLQASPDAPPRPDGAAAVTFEPGAMRPDQVAQLDGRRARFRVVPDSTVERVGGRDVFNLLVRDPADEGTVELYAGGRVEGGMTAQGTLRVPRHPPAVWKNGTAFVGFTEYRLVDTLRFGP
jgi:hypothetical protein